MKKSKYDHSIFYRQLKSSIILLAIYVEDIVIIGDNFLGISSLKNILHANFHTKVLGNLKYFLGLEVVRIKKGIFLSQGKYVLDLLTEIEKLGAKPYATQMVPNVQLTMDDSNLFDDLEIYRRLVGKLNCLTVTHLDNFYLVSIFD